MRQIKSAWRLMLPLIGLTMGCSPGGDQASPKAASAERDAAAFESNVNGDFRTLWWTDLLPKEDEAALSKPPDYLADIIDGSEEDQASGQMLTSDQLKNTKPAPAADPYQAALVSTRVIAEMDGEAIRIPGFVVPLEFNDEQVITEFFLVPYFGACIHQPPPPPNQIIWVSTDRGFKLDALYDPFWISGVLSTSITEHEVGTSAYSLKMYHHEPYTED